MDSEKGFKAAFWTLLVAGLLIRTSFAFRVWRAGERIGADRAARRREGVWAHVVAYLFLLLLAALGLYVVFQGGGLRSFAFGAPTWLRWIGIALGAASVALFVWTHVVLGRFWSPYVQLRAGHRLITAGPYSRMRHPMYLAIVGWMIGLGLIAANWIPLACAALGALQFLLRIQGEEAMMLQQFGDDYRRYMKRTGALLPAWSERESSMSATTNTGRLQRFVAMSLLVGSALGVYFLISTNQRTATTVVMPQWVPFWPAFALPYLSMLLVAWLLPLAIRDPANFRACLAAMLYAFLLVVALWILIPTRLQRPPLPEGWWADPYRWLAEIDPPHCVMPCAHGIGAMAAAWFVGLERPRCRWPLVAMLALGLPSIAFVGQHRPIDILIGMVATALGIGIGHAFMMKRGACSDDA